MEAWIYAQTGARYFVSQWSSNNGAFIQTNPTATGIEWYINGIGAGSVSITPNTWYHIIGTFDGSTARLYRNADSPVSSAHAAPNWPSEGTFIGDRSAGSRQFNGIIDEVRFSDVARSSGWIITSYSNQYDPSGFSSVGNEETLPTLDTWEVTLTLTGPNSVIDSLIFGEAPDASDGQDSYDTPKPSTPPVPFIYGWFSTNLTVPYNILWKEYKHYPDTYKQWNFSILWIDSGSGFVNITWNPSNLSVSEYSYISLHDINSDFDTDMLTNSYYNYTATSSIPSMFEIICSSIPLEYDHEIPVFEDWNIISVPFNRSYDKSNITVEYLDVNYTWTDAVTAGIIIDFFYGWNRSAQNYETKDALEPGEGYWIYSYYNCSFWITGEKNNDDYITNLLANWNMVGSPYDDPIEKQNLTIIYDETTYSWSDAVTAGIIIDFIYKWNASAQNYETTDVLAPDLGYWMYAYYDCTLKKD